MVNEPLPDNRLSHRAQRSWSERPGEIRWITRAIGALTAARSFAQILGKLFFFKLIENLRGILLNYGQMSRGPANRAFNGPC
jgi:hypothetical protein